jgi:CRP-like cAMP-binding protein
MRFFSAFADPELWEVIALGSWKRVPAGAPMVREGEHGDFFCMVVQGEARVTKNKKLLSVLGPGQCFGEMAYLSVSSHERGATVTAARESVIMQGEGWRSRQGLGRLPQQVRPRLHRHPRSSG